MRKSNLILSAAVFGLVSSAAQAATLYSASEVRTVDGLGVEPWSFSTGNSNRILFDDAFVTRPGNGYSTLSVGTVSVGLNQAPGAAATLANVYLAPMLDNTAGNATGVDPINTGDDAPDVGTPILLGSVALPANPGTSSQPYDVNVNTASLVNIAGYTGYAGKLGFLVGVSFTADPGNGFSTGDDGNHSWELARTTAPALFPAVYDSPSTTTGGYNLDVAWDFLDGTTSSEFSVLNPDNPGNPYYDAAGYLNTTFRMTVNGSVIPEPTSLGLLAVGSLLMLRRKR